MVRELLNFLLLHHRGIHNHLVVHGKSCRNGRSVSDHVEIELTILSIGTILDKAAVDGCTRGWISVLVVYLLDESRVDLLVDKAVEELGVVIRLETLDGSFNTRNLILHHVFLVTGTATTISVDSDL